MNRQPLAMRDCTSGAAVDAFRFGDLPSGAGVPALHRAFQYILNIIPGKIIGDDELDDLLAGDFCLYYNMSQKRKQRPLSFFACRWSSFLY